MQKGSYEGMFDFSYTCSATGFKFQFKILGVVKDRVYFAYKALNSGTHYMTMSPSKSIIHGRIMSPVYLRANPIENQENLQVFASHLKGILGWREFDINDIYFGRTLRKLPTVYYSYLGNSSRVAGENTHASIYLPSTLAQLRTLPPLGSKGKDQYP